MPADALSGIVVASLAEALAWRAERRRAGLRVAMTGGCFDVLHAGHVRYLQWARSQGDALLLALNADASVRALKGAPRPFVAFDDRAAVLAGLRSVDLVIGFADATPAALIEALRPDVWVKSAQYRVEDLPERAAVEAGGGTIALAPHLAGRSTTDLVALIRSTS
jgi:rfaE bifunctional protein nucleotidyltransferase chain/domain